MKQGLDGQLLGYGREVATLQSIGKLLAWDRQVCMPSEGTALRAEQAALVARWTQERLASPRLHDLLLEANGLVREGVLDDDDQATVRELWRAHARAHKVPLALVEELERTKALARQPWLDARRERDFLVFAPWLDRLVRLTKQWIDAVGYVEEPYNALLDVYEPGLTTRTMDSLFGQLVPHLLDLLSRIQAAKRQPDAAILQRDYDLTELHSFAERVVQDLGFNLSQGRFDHSAHSFCTGVNMTDVRLATAVNEENPIDSLFALVHEGGHGLYHQGLSPAAFGAARGAAVSLGVHESQARWWENCLCRSRPFWEHYYPSFQKQFSSLAEIGVDEFFHAVNLVRPGLIRVDADEVTYNLHIVVRFNLERALFRDELSVNDICDAWCDEMRRLLGVQPADDTQGVLQDVHWSQALFGYFATYTLGNIYAAQLDRTMRIEIPDLDRHISAGEFDAVLQWMRAKIHRHGSVYEPAALIERSTGEPPSAVHLIEYLASKFAAIYELSRTSERWPSGTH